MLLFLLLATCVAALPVDYSVYRAYVLLRERQREIGGNLAFADGEKAANSILMSAKYKELDSVFDEPWNFAPAKHFLSAKRNIENSTVYKIIREMPKGAVLHVHDASMASTDYVFHNITYRDNLYACKQNGQLQLMFFAQPDDKCNWTLLEDIRKDPEDGNRIDEELWENLSMETEDPEAAYPGLQPAWDKANIIFKFVRPLLTYKPVFEDYYYQTLQEIYDDNIMYIEIRTSLKPLYDLDGTVYDQLEKVRIYKEITERFMKDHPDFIGAKLIYAPKRSVDPSGIDGYLNLAQTIKAKYPDFVLGFDLVGQEDKGKPLSEFITQLLKFPKNLGFYFHAGETNWYGLSTDINLIDAILLGSKRIGHGYALPKHPEVLDLMREWNVAVEVNPISNQVLGLVKDLRNHPASVLFAEGFPVVVSNDDPGIWNTKGLSYDFYEAFMGMMSRQADIRSLKQLAMNSLLYSGLNIYEKQRALKSLLEKWDAFVKKLDDGHIAM